jgi:HEAT repeat protein
MPSVVDYHIGRLKDKSASVRARSARELGLIGDPTALPALEECFRVETSADVKKAIQEAGRAIYKRQMKNDNTDQTGG